jgi:hypothetical protein
MLTDTTPLFLFNQMGDRDEWKRRNSIFVETTDDGCFQIRLEKGLFDKKHMVAESVDSLLQKATVFLKTELSRNPK